MGVTADVAAKRVEAGRQDVAQQVGDDVRPDACRTAQAGLASRVRQPIAVKLHHGVAELVPEIPRISVQQGAIYPLADVTRFRAPVFDHGYRAGSGCSSRASSARRTRARSRAASAATTRRPKGVSL